MTRECEHYLSQQVYSYTVLPSPKTRPQPNSVHQGVAVSFNGISVRQSWQGRGDLSWAGDQNCAFTVLEPAWFHSITPGLWGPWKRERKGGLCFHSQSVEKSAEEFEKEKMWPSDFF